MPGTDETEVRLDPTNAAERRTLLWVLSINFSQVIVAGTVGIPADSTGLLGAALDKPEGRRCLCRQPVRCRSYGRRQSARRTAIRGAPDRPRLGAAGRGSPSVFHTADPIGCWNQPVLLPEGGTATARSPCRSSRRCAVPVSILPNSIARCLRASPIQCCRAAQAPPRQDDVS